MFVRYFLHFLVCIKSTSVLSDLVKFELKYVSQGAILNTVQGLSKISCYLRCKNQHGCMYTGYESCKGKDICLSNTKVCFSLNSPGTDNVPNNKEPYWRLEVGQPIAQIGIMNRSNALPNCNFQDGDVVASTFHKITSDPIAPEQCITKCRQRNPQYNGITMRRSLMKTCYCNLQSTGFKPTYKSCYIDNCIFMNGEAIGSTEEKIHDGPITTQQCLTLCSNKRVNNTAINGITMKEDLAEDCYCVENMNGTQPFYKSCIFT